MRIQTFPVVVVLSFCLAGFESVTAQGLDSYQIVNQYPHDSSAFTQGLILHDGRLFESTGLRGSSSLREVDLRTGAVLRKLDVPRPHFAEGMTIFNGRIYQLTWQSQVAFVYDLETFAYLGEHWYSGEGWGLTHDSQHLIMSNGSSEIRFLDPATFQTVRTINVTYGEGTPLGYLNELEYIDGEIYANVWTTDWIVRIDPSSGRVVGWMDMTGLLPPGTSADVLNGIAHDPATGHLLVTGKWWPTLFEIHVLRGGGVAPTADDRAAWTTEDTPLPITLTASDPDSSSLTYTVVAQPVHGALAGSAPHLLYTPAPDFHGSDRFSFQASDGSRESNVATISITVAPVNDPPFAAVNAYVTAADTPLVVGAPGVLGNDGDVDGQALAAVLVSPPSSGALTLQADGSFVYVPSQGFSGLDGFTYAASDGVLASVASVSLTVNASAASPTLSLSPTSLRFGNQTVGTTSGLKAVTLSNTGSAPLVIGSISIIGPDAGEFWQTSSCLGSLAAGASCTVHVAFTPAVAATRRATLVIASNAAGSPHAVALSGAGKKERGGR